MIGAGVVGLGFGARVHVPGLRRVDGVEVVAVCSRSGAAEAAARLRVPRAYDDWRALIDDERVELVSVATPPAVRPAVVLAALEAGKSVLAEKPLGVTAAEAEALAEAARAAVTPSAVDFEFRFVPAFARARALLAGGGVGEVQSANVRWTLATRTRSPLPSSWKDDPARGGGALLGLGVHVFDYVEWLVGPVVRVRGTLEHVVPGSSETGFSAELETSRGPRVGILVTNAAAAPEGHVVQIRGTSGSLALENREPDDYMRSFRLDAPGEAVVPAATDEDGRIAPFAALAGELVAAMRQGRHVEPSFDAGARAQRLAEAVVRSNGEWLPAPV